MPPAPRSRLRWPLAAALLAGFLPALGVMYNSDTGDEKSRALAQLPPFQSKAQLQGIGCSAVLIAPDAALCASHCVNYAATGTVGVAWNGQVRSGTFWTTGADVIVIKLDSGFTGAAGKCTAPYAGNTELNRLAWKVGFGGSGVIGTGSTPVNYDGIARAMTNRVEVNNVANPPPAVSADGNWLFYDMDDAPGFATRPTTLYEGGTAPGDSGGPLYMYEGGRWWVIGVTSGPDAGYYRDGRVRTDIAEIKTRTGHDWALPVTPALEMKWVAQDLAGTIAEGGVVAAWPRQGGSEAWTNAAADGGVGTATLDAAATPTNQAAVRFGGAARLGLPAASNPVAGESSFTVALVFKANAAGAAGEGHWFDNTGLLDADEAGPVRDWGIALAGSGHPALGVGAPDATLYQAGASLADGNWHVLVATWDGADVSGDAAGADKNMNLYVDGIDSAVRRAGPDFMDVARNAASLALGGSRNAARYFDGAIAEVRLYRGALDAAAAAALIAELRTTHIAPTLGLTLTRPANGRAGVPLGQALVVEGTLTGSAPTVAITQISGAGAATISPVNALPAQITFPGTGLYQFQIAATDGSGTRSIPIIVEVVPSAAPPGSVSPARTLAGPWTALNLGDAATAGSQTLTATSASLTGSGLGFQEVSDSARFIWQPLTGDGSITARVASFVSDNGGAAFGGVMLRNSLDRESANVAATVRSAGDVRFSRRFEAAAYTEITTAALSKPLWVRLIRTGNSFTCFHSPDGLAWTQLGPAQTLAGAPATMFAGLVMASINNNGNSVANFDNIAIVESGSTSVAPVIALPGGQNPNAANAFTIAATSNETPTWSWSKVSGPGAVTFSLQNTAAPRVAYTQAGSYTLRASADDGAVKTAVERVFALNLDARWNFNTADNAEGWSGVNTAAFTVAAGVLSSSATTGDPWVRKDGAAFVSGDLAKHLLVRYRGSATGSAQWFWGRVGAGGYVGGRLVTASYSPANTWKTILFDVSAHPEWATRIITDLRFDPPGGVGATFDVDWFALSDGDFDNDGISDLAETTNDADSDGLANLEDLDSDNDTLPDGYESANGLNATSAADAVQDKDGDGQSNLAEYQAGTNPRSAADVLQVVSSSRSATSFTAIVAGRADRRYVLERKPTLTAPTWTIAATSSTITTDAAVTLTDPSAPAGAAFYRVRVEWP